MPNPCKGTATAGLPSNQNFIPTQSDKVKLSPILYYFSKMKGEFYVRLDTMRETSQFSKINFSYLPPCGLTLIFQLQGHQSVVQLCHLSSHALHLQFRRNHLCNQNKISLHQNLCLTEKIFYSKKEEKRQSFPKL